MQKLNNKTHTHTKKKLLSTKLYLTDKQIGENK